MFQGRFQDLKNDLLESTVDVRAHKQFRPRLATTELLIYTRDKSTMGAKRLVGPKDEWGRNDQGENDQGRKRLGAKRLGEEFFCLGAKRPGFENKTAYRHAFLAPPTYLFDAY